MPLTYTPSGAPGTKLGELRTIRETLERLERVVEKQNDLLEKLTKTQTKTRKYTTHHSPEPTFGLFHAPTFPHSFNVAQ